MVLGKKKGEKKIVTQILDQKDFKTSVWELYGK